MSVLNTEQLASLSPFKEFSSNVLQPLLAQAEAVTFETGDTILRKNQERRFRNYLLAGSVEIRASFFERFNLEHSDRRAEKALEELSALDAQVTAQSTCHIARFTLDAITKARSQSPLPNYALDEISSDNLDSDCRVEDTALEADWMSGFLHSPLVNHVSARDIHKMLQQMEDIQYAAGDKVVSNGGYGDSFYVVKSGLAIVHTDPKGSYRGREFALMPGSYFGEEALVGQTIRNAEVYMEVAGVVGKLGADAFNSFIRDPLIVRTGTESIANIIEEPGEHNVILDVRLYPEFRHGHRCNSRNVPLAALREKLDEFDIAKNYYITPEGGPRSELATFMMRQAGFNAVLIQE